jgi:hypothetical protein
VALILHLGVASGGGEALGSHLFHLLFHFKLFKALQL